MSRIAKYPIVLPEKVNIEVNNQVVSVTGARGALTLPIPEQVEVKVDKGMIQVVPLSQDRRVRCLAGTFRANLKNQVQGVSQGFSCTLSLVRVGARAQVEGNTLVVIIGYSNPKRYQIPAEVTITTPAATEILIQGIDIQKVTQVAAEIIRIRPPEPYKGTGILKKGQKITLKAAKKK